MYTLITSLIEYIYFSKQHAKGQKNVLYLKESFIWFQTPLYTTILTELIKMNYEEKLEAFGCVF